jgi:hypothetical protein
MRVLTESELMHFMRMKIVQEITDEGEFKR